MALYYAPRTYTLQNGGDSYSYKATGNTMRFEVRRGDRPSFDSSGVERSEIVSSKEIDFGKTYTLKYKFMIEAGAKLTSKWMLLGQIHHRNDPGEKGGSPPFGIEVNGETMRVISRSSTDAIRKSNPDPKSLWKDDAPLQKGKWYDMKFEVKLDPFGKGMVNMWMNGKQELAYKGAIGYNDKEGGYLKMGVYRTTSPEKVAVKYDNVELLLGTKSAAPAPASTSAKTSAAQATVDPYGHDTDAGISGDRIFAYTPKGASADAGQAHFFYEPAKRAAVMDGYTDSDLTPELPIESRATAAFQTSDFVL